MPAGNDDVILFHNMTNDALTKKLRYFKGFNICRNYIRHIYSHDKIYAFGRYISQKHVNRYTWKCKIARARLFLQKL